MKKRRHAELGLANFALAALAALPLAACAQTPVDDDGAVIGAHQPAYSDAVESGATGNEDIPLMSDAELEELIGPIALYPDDLLAIVLPATAYPLQIIDAARFLEELENDATLKPDPDWDDSVVALLNYPEVIELLNEDIDWTWRLGEAVVSQQGDVVAAIETFRDRAYAAGNLKSDSYQNVTRDDGVIEITPVSEDVIYVPYYEPERVVVYQPRPVYYYYPRSYPVYYYPYSSAYHFDRGYFWGVTTAFTIGWLSDSLHVYHHSYYGHPYYGHSYWDRWWYRRPSINVYNTTYSYNSRVTINRYYTGDTWRPRHNRRDYVYDERITRNRHYQQRSGAEPRVRQRDDNRTVQRANSRTVQRSNTRVDQRSNTLVDQRSNNRVDQRSNTRTVERQTPITFRERPTEHRSTNRQAPVRQTREQQRRPAPTQRVREPGQPDLQARLEQRRQAPTQRVQERREPDVQARQQQRRQAPVQRAQERREPVRQATPERRSTPAQRQAALPRSTERRVPQQATVQQRREPAAQQSQVRRETPRQTRSPERVQRAAPPRQESRAPKSEPQRAKPRKSESRSESGRRSESRARH